MSKFIGDVTTPAIGEGCASTYVGKRCKFRYISCRCLEGSRRQQMVAHSVITRNESENYMKVKKTMHSNSSIPSKGIQFRSSKQPSVMKTFLDLTSISKCDISYDQLHLLSIFTVHILNCPRPGWNVCCISQN